MDFIERIEHLLENTMSAVKAAAERCDVHALQQLTRRSQQLKTLKDRAVAMDEELRDLESGASDGTQRVESHPERDEVRVARDSNAHRLLIEVTQGMINQNLLTLTEHVNAGRIRPGGEITIEAKPSGELFSTELLSDGNRLRERGAVARFYRDARVNAGDTVVLKQESPHRWILEKLQVGQSSLPPIVRLENDQI